MMYVGSRISIQDATGILEFAISIIDDLQLSMGFDPAERCLNAHEVLAAAQFALDQHMSEVRKQ